MSRHYALVQALQQHINSLAIFKGVLYSMKAYQVSYYVHAYCIMPTAVYVYLVCLFEG